jgi:hypothetical protein
MVHGFLRVRPPSDKIKKNIQTVSVPCQKTLWSWWIPLSGAIHDHIQSSLQYEAPSFVSWSECQENAFIVLAEIWTTAEYKNIARPECHKHTHTHTHTVTWALLSRIGHSLQSVFLPNEDQILATCMAIWQNNCSQLRKRKTKLKIKPSLIWVTIKCCLHTVLRKLSVHTDQKK